MAYCEVLVKGVFQMIGVDHTNHLPCYYTCVKKCVQTGVLKATTWSSWGGYRDVSVEVHADDSCILQYMSSTAISCEAQTDHLEDVLDFQ
ncbi:hypothetical protein Trco_008217 [Trichoderma cornu-damae]|uniref:Uncharacterized protein n=1 Tax=Trichoderma cornu-damae TaxID=654480 RepID=A0A9P8TSY3_9HYPO|nr:hypothetical protein Trco_008217 [Trichoderma cornu-damae]